MGSESESNGHGICRESRNTTIAANNITGYGRYCLGSLSRRVDILLTFIGISSFLIDFVDQGRIRSYRRS